MSIIKDFIELNDGYKIGVITLNNPDSLNAQTLEMVRETSALLSLWQDDVHIVAVLFRGMGEKAFCAGGDIRGLYHHYNDQEFPNPLALQFFVTEYGLCKQIKAYPKPCIVWASGIVMGGGMGIATPCSHRIVTQTTMMAMPEVAIGLFPDAGGSYFLKHMPDRLGLFLGLTGARFNGADALALGVADYAMDSADFDILITALSSLAWTDNRSDNETLLNNCLDKLSNPTLLGDGWLLPNRAQASALVVVDSLQDFDRLARSGQYDDNEYIAKALASYRQGCPTSAGLAWQIHHKVDGYSFNQVMDMELIVALYCCHFGEFAEGVRALLIDKDKNPKWHYTIDTLPQSHLDVHFVPW